MAMKSELPGSIARRPKQPYRAPDSSSFFSDGKPVDYVRELMSPARIRAAGIFDATAIGKLVAKCSSGRALGFGDNMASSEPSPRCCFTSSSSHRLGVPSRFLRHG